jgi:hypothetical protein
MHVSLFIDHQKTYCVGVGTEDFSSMKVLDGDKGLLKSGSRTAQRDIVQFVA